jgi:hypothetical protein
MHFPHQKTTKMTEDSIIMQYSIFNLLHLENKMGNLEVLNHTGTWWFVISRVSIVYHERDSELCNVHVKWITMANQRIQYLMHTMCVLADNNLSQENDFVTNRILPTYFHVITLIRPKYSWETRKPGIILMGLRKDHGKQYILIIRSWVNESNAAIHWLHTKMLCFQYTTNLCLETTRWTNRGGL